MLIIITTIINSNINTYMFTYIIHYWFLVLIFKECSTDMVQLTTSKIYKIVYFYYLQEDSKDLFHSDSNCN